MKPVFKLEDYPGKVVMHCPEKWMAEKFCKFLHDAGRKWESGKEYSEYTGWRDSEPEMYYLFNEGLLASAEYFRTHTEYTVLEYSDFDWPDDATTTHTLTEALINERFSCLLSDCPCAETPAEAARELEAVFTAWAGALDEYRSATR